MILVEYPKCSTCQKAKKYLIDKKITFNDRNIKEEKLRKDELKELIKLSGKEINKFFNTSGLKYRELDLKNKLKSMTDDEKLELLATDGMLVKRPILITDNTCLVGFKQNEWENLK